jgi:hypothetical protein
VGTIRDDDPEPTLSISDASVTEGNAGPVSAVFTVTLSAASGRVVSVTYATADGTASAGTDYISTGGTLVFAPGQTTRALTVTVLGDTLDEPDETFTVNLSNAVNAAIADGQGVGTIRDDDPEPTLSISDASVTEGNAGPVSAVFTVTLSAASGRVVTVTYATADGTASAGADYISTGGTLVFAPGQTTRALTVTVNGDTLDEEDETFFVNLTGAVNAAIADGQGVGTIRDDDPEPGLSISDASVTEGNAGPVSAVFTVTLSAASGRVVTVTYATADGSATAGTDYNSAGGTLTFAPGETTRTLTVTVNGDTLDEPNETFFVNLSNAVNAAIADGQGVGTILDDDPEPTLSISDASVTEGDSGTTTAVFTVTLSAASGRVVSVTYATADGTASAGADYNSASGTLTFAPGALTQFLTVTVNGDTLDEPNETFFVNLSNPVHAVIADGQGVGTILDDDPEPTLSISDASVTEGNAGPVSAVFTVTLSAASGRVVSVTYATADGTATAGTDYIGANGILVFAPGQTSRTLTVTVLGDTLDEPDETFTVNLSNAVNAAIADGQGVGTILDDDPEPTLSISDTSVTEGNAGPVSAVFTVTLSAASGRVVSVTYATADGTATAGTDYIGANGILVFAPGQTSRTLTVTVLGDTLDEPDETFTVNLSNAVNAAIADGQGVGTILDDDPEPTLSISDTSVTEGNAGPVSAVFTVTLSAASGRVVTVTYATADGTASAGADYISTGGTLVFAPGQTSRALTVTVNRGHPGRGPDETFTVNLSNAVNAAIADGQGVGTIRDDDPEPTLSISDTSVTEGNAGPVSAVFTVTLSAASGRVVSVTYATADGTATAGTDYIGANGILVFAPGQTSRTLTVTVLGDTLDEPDETFTVNLSNAVNAAIADGQGVGTIRDDDFRIYLPLVVRTTLGPNATRTSPIVVTLDGTDRKASPFGTKR